MTEVSFSSSFQRAFKKKIKEQPALETKFWEKVELFIKNPFDRSLRSHKLSGKLGEVWSFSIDYDVRVLYYFTKDKKAVFINIGSHDEVY